MSKLSVNELTDEQGSGRPSFTNGVQTSNINGGQVGGRRNLIINGDMRVAQRGTSATGITGTGYYTADRARLSITGMGGNQLVDQEVLFDQTVDSNTVNVLKMTIAATSSTGELGYNQRLEVDDVKHLIGKKFTFSAYVKADSPIDLITFSAIDNNTGNFGSIFLISGPITISNSWQRIVGTATFNDILSSDYLDLLIRFNPSVATSFYITMVQFEEGDTATEFEHRSFGEELALCQRYYYEYSRSVDGTSRIAGAVMRGNTLMYGFGTPHPTTMRASPSVSSSDISVFKGDITSNVTLDAEATTKNWAADGTADSSLSSTNGDAVMVHLNGAGFISFDAEL